MPTTVKKLLRQKKIKDIISVPSTATVFEALKELDKYNIGALLIVDNDKLVGIFSEKDYARKGIIKGRKAKSTTMKEVMTPDVITVDSTMNLSDCMNLMSDKHIRHLPVVDEEKITGILSVGDLVTATILEQRQHIKFLEKYIMG